MRAPKNEATGTSGESRVLADFQSLGWAGLIDSRHDSGTDLYLRPRNPNRYELGVMMGAQVKTGHHYFRSPKRNTEGTIIGWWFTENDREHFDYWISHSLPHILVLHDQVAKRSYWVHITQESVKSTGKGAKILVPTSQTVDNENNGALIDVALTQLPTPSWNGTAWTGAKLPSPDDEIRHSLITPRLIAPHPNFGFDSVSGPQALAMQILFRNEIDRILDQDNFPFVRPSADIEQTGMPPQDELTTDDWCWRATVAIRHWQSQGEPAYLRELVDLASKPSERAAGAVLRCVYHFAKNAPDEALRVLENTLEHEDYSAVDHAWLQVQRARALLEIGQHEAAFDLAVETQRIFREAPSDATAAAIAGACALISFNASDWLQGDIGNTIQHSDHPASWWRTQKMFYGLSTHLSEEFRGWSEDPSTRSGSWDTPPKQFVSAAWIASCAGDHDGWRAAVKILAQHSLVNTGPEDDPSKIADWLTLLRLSGDSERTRNATRRVAERGPISAVRIAASRVNLLRSTRTTALSDIELLRASGDVLEPDHADEICLWALAMLQDQQAYSERVRPQFKVDEKIIELLESIACTVNKKPLQKVIDYFLELPPLTDRGFACAVAALIHRIPACAWSERNRQRAADRAKHDDTYLRQSFLRVSAVSSSKSRQQILEQASAGDLSAFEAIDDVRKLPPDAVDALTSQLCRSIDNLIAKAAEGSYAHGVLDFGEALAILGIWHPAKARWEFIKALLTAPNVLPYQFSGALSILAHKGEKLDASTKGKLVEAVLPLRHRKPPQRRLLGGDKDIRALANEALAALMDDCSRRSLIRDLLIGDTEHRAASARIIGRFGESGDAELLLALVGDTDESVRDSSLYGLSRLATTKQTSERVAPILSKVLQYGGTRSAMAVVLGLPATSEIPAVSRLLALAARHPSARVRNTVWERTQTDQ